MPEDSQPSEDPSETTEKVEDSGQKSPEPDEASELAEPAFDWRETLRRWCTIRDLPTHKEAVSAGFACIGLILLLWFVVTLGPAEKRIVSAYTLPSPWEALKSFPLLWTERGLFKATFWSLGRVMSGFLLAAAFAVPLGVVAASYPRVNAFLRPVSVFGRNIPIAALIPLSLMWFGIGESQKIMFIFFASVAFILFDATNAVNRVSSRFLDTAYTLGAKPVLQSGMRRAFSIGGIYAAVLAIGLTVFEMIDTPGTSISQVFGQSGVWTAALLGLIGGFLVWLPILSHQAVSKVLLPLALSGIVNSLRLLFGLAFGYIMLAEVINAKTGLGHIINMSQRRPPREHIYLILIIIALLAFGIDRLVLAMQRRWFPYLEDADA